MRRPGLRQLTMGGFDLAQVAIGPLAVRGHASDDLLEVGLVPALGEGQLARAHGLPLGRAQEHDDRRVRDALLGLRLEAKREDFTGAAACNCACPAPRRAFAPASSAIVPPVR